MRRKTFEDTKTKVSLLNSHGNIALPGEKIKKMGLYVYCPPIPLTVTTPLPSTTKAVGDLCYWS